MAAAAHGTSQLLGKDMSLDAFASAMPSFMQSGKEVSAEDMKQALAKLTPMEKGAMWYIRYRASRKAGFFAVPPPPLRPRRALTPSHQAGADVEGKAASRDAYTKRTLVAWYVKRAVLISALVGALSAVVSGLFDMWMVSSGQVEAGSEEAAGNSAAFAGVISIVELLVVYETSVRSVGCVCSRCRRRRPPPTRLTPDARPGPSQTRSGSACGRWTTSAPSWRPPCRARPWTWPTRGRPRTA